MKPKNVVLIGIAVCAISVLLMSPALANGDDFVLGVYGNANEDDTIDMRDLTYVKLIFFGKKPETELADAKYDGKINPLDFIQIKLIIVGKEKELTIVDSADRIVTVNMPIERIVAFTSNSAESVKILGEVDKIVGVGSYVITTSYYYPELVDKTVICSEMAEEVDYEAIVALEPDLVIGYTEYFPGIAEVADHLEPFGIPAVGLDLFLHGTLKEEIAKLGYILNKRNEAEEYVDWFEEHEEIVKDLVDDLKEEDKPRVFMEFWEYSLSEILTFGEGSGEHDLCTMAGGINIAGDLEAGPYMEYPIVDSEWIIDENPDVIINPKFYIWGWDNTEEPEGLIEDIKSRSGWANMDAVENNTVYVCTWEIVAGPDSVVGLTYWAKLLHPEFDLDPNSLYEEYLSKYMDIEYPDLIFVYPT
jgi:iron complex transport system substrate-binding protein